MSYCQKIEPQDIYLIFEENKGDRPKALGKKFYDNNGLNFNLNKYYFLYKSGFEKKTYDKKQLKCFNIIKENEIETLEIEFRKKTAGKKPKGKHEKIYQFYDRNDIFDPYIIEILKDKIIVYKVIFRNEGLTE